MANEPLLFEKVRYSKEQFFNTYKALTDTEPNHVLLESGRSGRYSIAGIKPLAIINSNTGTIQLNDGKKVVLDQTKSPLFSMREWMKQFAFPPLDGLPDFQGGAIGYISYDYGRRIENIPNIATDDLMFPELFFLVFDEWAVYDHEEHTLWLMVLNQNDAVTRLERVKNQWLQPNHKQLTEKKVNQQKGKPSNSMTKEAFIKAVQHIKQHIEARNVEQVNLTVRQSRPIIVDPIHIYEELRDLNPSPYMGYLHTPDFQIVSGSPEMLIQKERQIIYTRPIAGTRPRGSDEADDQRLENELLSTKKEIEEHKMLVQIEEEDFLKVCHKETVQIDEYMKIEKYSHVMHIVSLVSGTLANDKNAYDVLEAVFPGGSITGSPKRRSMEIIEELEPFRRSVYTGTLGWIGFNEDVHMNVVIRTMLIKDGIGHVQAGAGIVHDSEPEAEYIESLNKARALWQAMEIAEKKHTT